MKLPKGSEDLSAEERNDEVSQPVVQAGQTLGKKGAEKATRKLRKKMAKAAKKAVAKVGKAAAKAVAAGLKALFVAILPLLPYIIGVMLIIGLVFFAYDIMVETRPKNQELQSEVVEEMNEYSDIPDESGHLPVVSTSQGNAMVKVFYTYFSDQSYWIVTDDSDDKTKPISPLDPEVEDKQIKDKYGREEMFYISPDALFALDEMLHEGEFKAPEQFIQPVPYKVNDNGDLELIDIYDEEKKKMNVKSTKYDKDGKPTEEKTEGVWDYGFAPVMNYKEFEEEMQYKGRVTQVQKWDKERQEAVWVSATGKDSDVVETDVTSLGNVWLIDQLVSPGGTIRNEIRHEWQDTGEAWLPDPSEYTYTEKVDIRKWPLVHQKDENGKKLYYHWNKEESNKPYLSTEKSDHPFMMVEETYVKEERTFQKKVEGTRWEKVPEYVGEPDFSGVTGTKYYKDYMTSYKTYLPKEVMTEFDIAERIKTTDKKLLDLITPTETDGSTLDGSVTQADVEGLQLGKDASNENYMRSLENLHYFEKYGDMYGVDPYLLVAIAARESGGSHYDSNGNVKVGAATGLMQIENLGNRSVSAYNFETKQQESFSVNPTTVKDIEANIKWATMYLASQIKRYNYDVLVGLQSYNYGSYYKSQPWSLEGAKSYQNEVMGGAGDSNYVPNVMQYYASPNSPVPYVVTTEGETAALGDSELPMGTVDSINSSVLGSQTRGLWSKFSSKVKFGWNEIKEGFMDTFNLNPKNSVQFHGVSDKEARLEVNKGKDPQEAMEITMSMLAYQEGKPLSDYQNMTEEEFKTRFKLMFSNPFGGTIGGTGSTASPGINPAEFFTNGDYTSPVDKAKVITKYGFTGEDGKQTYHPGIDIAVTVGQDIKAVAKGKVIAVETGKNSQIVIEHSMGTVTSYSYVGEILVKNGDYVKKGEVIAKGGKSSEKEGTFHFELNQHGRTKDPTWIVDPSQLAQGGSIVIDPNAKGLFQNPFAGKPYTKTSNYGMRIHPIRKTPKLHSGTDLVAAAGAGAPIHAIGDGEVVISKFDSGWGNYVVIDHGIIPEIDGSKNTFSLYAHMQTGSVKVSAGQKVVKGQQVGGMGTTGSSTGDHLHLEMHVGTSFSNRQSFDPAMVFDF